MSEELQMHSKKPSLLVPEEHAKAEHGKVSTSYTIFLIVVLIVMAFVTAVFITNAVFYEAIRKQASACGGAVSKNEADVLFWLNVVLAVIAAILLLVSIVLLFFAYKKPKFTEKYIGKYQVGSKLQPLAAHVGLRADEFGRGARRVGAFAQKDLAVVGGHARRIGGEAARRARGVAIGAYGGGKAGYYDASGVAARGVVVPPSMVSAPGRSGRPSDVIGRRRSL